MKEPKLTIPALIKWLKTQDLNTKYDYCDNKDCLLARFVRSQGFEDFSVDPWYVYVGNEKFKIPQKLNNISAVDPEGSSILKMQPLWTYREALARALDQLNR